MQSTEIIVIGEAAEIEGNSMGQEARQMGYPAWEPPNENLGEFFSSFTRLAPEAKISQVLVVCDLIMAQTKQFIMFRI